MVASFSIFVNNLPGNSDFLSLAQIFFKFGKVWDAYIPNRSRMQNRKNSFVRFRKREEVMFAIEGFDREHNQRLSIEGRLVKYEKCMYIEETAMGGRNFLKFRQFWRPKKLAEAKTLLFD